MRFATTALHFAYCESAQNCCSDFASFNNSITAIERLTEIGNLIAHAFVEAKASAKLCIPDLHTASSSFDIS